MSVASGKFTRASGSFLTDGFAAGMELLSAGFSTANNGRFVVQSVTATTVTVTGVLSNQASGSGRSLTVGIPILRALENTEFEPVSGRPYWREEFVPATTSQVHYPADGGMVEETGIYFGKYYGLKGKGSLAIRRTMQALKESFAPGTELVTSAGDAVRIRGRPGPTTGQILPLEGGWSVCTISVPWRAYSENLVTA
jgi:hypothetical protein